MQDRAVSGFWGDNLSRLVVALVLQRPSRRSERMPLRSVNRADFGGPVILRLVSGTSRSTDAWLPIADAWPGCPNELMPPSAQVNQPNNKFQNGDLLF